MTNFILKKLPYDLSSHTGLAFVDTHAEAWLDRLSQMNQVLLSSLIYVRPIDCGALGCSYTPVDLDNTCINTRSSQKSRKIKEAGPDLVP